MDELKSVIKKDITRKITEGVAFKAFEDWWDTQEKKTRVSSSLSHTHRKVLFDECAPLTLFIVAFFFQDPGVSFEK